ncbi:MAG: hypothetical protein R3B70_44480 [Polyangiaceae bacterium]
MPRWASLLFAVGVVQFLEMIVSVEWAAPDCNDPQDGPVYALFGAPLPYERFSGASSMMYDFVPWMYVINIGILSLLLWWGIRGVEKRIRGRMPRWVTGAAVASGGALAALSLAVHGVWIGLGMWYPVETPHAISYRAYHELRPVGVALGRHYDCKASTFWFGPDKRPPRRGE